MVCDTKLLDNFLRVKVTEELKRGFINVPSINVKGSFQLGLLFLHPSRLLKQADVQQLASKVADGFEIVRTFLPIQVEQHDARTCSLHRSKQLVLAGEVFGGVLTEEGNRPDQGVNNLV